MTQPASKFFKFHHDSKDYSIHYLDWSQAENPLLFCAHGLTRNAHDFDYLARAVSAQFRVIAIDYPGRGLSQWLDNKNDYVIPTYVSVTLALFDYLRSGPVNWLGTSMGGLIGMIMAAGYPDKFTRLIINDVGPELSQTAVSRINDYLSTNPEFHSMQEFEQHLREIYAPFGPLNDDQWRHLARHSYRTNSQGRILSNYDPGIVTPFQQSETTKTDLWSVWQSLSASLYLLYGENSDILSTAIIEKMKRLQPDLTAVSVKNVGHAPALMDDDQIEHIRHWLNA